LECADGINEARPRRVEEGCMPNIGKQFGEACDTFFLT